MRALVLGGALVLVLGVAPAAFAQSAPTAVGFSLADPAGGLFPSDLFTQLDPAQRTGRRVALPLPDCGEPSAPCDRIALLNELDGFNLRPRVALPFTGAIRPQTVTPETAFAIRLDGEARRIGIDRGLLDFDRRTVVAELAATLEQSTRYALVVTRGVIDAQGEPVAALDVENRLVQLRAAGPSGVELASALERALDQLANSGLRRAQIAGLTVFTTQSVTALLERVRDQLARIRPEPARFDVGRAASPGMPVESCPLQRGSRTVFAREQIASLWLRRQATLLPTFDPVPLPIEALDALPGAVSQIAFGRYDSPDFTLGPDVAEPAAIEAVGTARDPLPGVMTPVFFNLFLPAGARPAGGWPVAIYGHGFGGSKNDGALSQAAVQAAQGIALIAINVQGHGGGPASTLRIMGPNGQRTELCAGGRSRDINGDQRIGPTEGSAALSAIGARDGIRQTVIDLMQLVRVIEEGVDVDGDGSRDLDASRISYLGQSFGGIYGTLLLAVDPAVGVGALNVTGGPLAEIGRFAMEDGEALVPPRGMPLVEILSDAPDDDPLPELEALDQNEWLEQSASPVAVARHLRRDPLPGVPPKRFVFQFATGDLTIPNPTSTAMIRAGDFVDRTTYFRNDVLLAQDVTEDFGASPMRTVPENPHLFLTRLMHPDPRVALAALQAQQQIATLFGSRGAMLVDPDGRAELFETPIAGPLPEGVNRFVPPEPPPMEDEADGEAEDPMAAPGAPGAP